MAQLGMTDRLAENVDPWLCYYCGDCSDTCPRGAEPAETMMALRRWLISKYDVTGKARELYTSEKNVLFTIFRTSLLPLVLLVVYHLITLGRNINTDQVELNKFAPVLWVWAIVLIHFVYLGWHLLRNSLTMIKNVLGPDSNFWSIPIGAYLEGIKDFIIQLTTQRRWWSNCDPKERKVEINRWAKHLLLITGYVIMIILIVPFLWWFQTDEIFPLYHPQRWLGYYATIALIVTSVEILYSRIKKNEQIHRFSQPSDWLFPSFLLTGAITGIFVHIFRYMQFPWPTYIIYTIHVMAMVAMLDTEVGIGKWTHLIYRPLAISLDALKKKNEEFAGELAAAD
jgi:ferredoxin